jgi:hypothetical protein
VALLLACTLAAGCGGGSRRSAAGPEPSGDPYLASVAYAKCMRAHGVPHPDPDRKGDFSLTPADERRMRAIGPAKREAAEKACFRNLKGLNLRPLTREAQARAKKVLQELGACIRKKGHVVGNPVVKNLSRGRAFFGFDSAGPDARTKTYLRDSHACEKQVRLAPRISKIIEEDRKQQADGL